MGTQEKGNLKFHEPEKPRPAKLIVASKDGAELSYIWTRNDYGGYKLFCVGKMSAKQKSPKVYPIVAEDSSKFYCDCMFLDDFASHGKKSGWTCSGEIDLSSAHGKDVSYRAMKLITKYADSFTDYWGNQQGGVQVHYWMLARRQSGGFPRLFVIWSDEANAYAGEFVANVTSMTRGNDVDTDMSISQCKMVYCWETPSEDFMGEREKAIRLYQSSMETTSTFSFPTYEWMKKHRLCEKLPVEIGNSKLLVQMPEDVFFSGAFTPVPGCYYETMPLNQFTVGKGLEAVPFADGTFIWDDFGTCHILT